MERRDPGTQTFSMLQGHRWPLGCDLALLALVLAATVAFGRVADVDGWNATRFLAATSSLAEDGDLDLRNDVLRSVLPARQIVELAKGTPSEGPPFSSLSLGPSLLWLPAYLLARPITSDSISPLERWDPLQRIALQALSIALLLVVMRFLALLLRRLGASDHAAVGGATALLLGTPLFVYATSAYTESHLAAVTASCALMLCLLALERNANALSAAAAGAAIGCVFLCRWQDIPLALLLLAPALTLRRRIGNGRSLALVATSLGVAAIPIGAQLFVWARQSGSLVPHTTDPSISSLWTVLFSTHSGVLFWSPLLLIATVGLLLPWRCELRAHWRGALLLTLAVHLLLNAFVFTGSGETHAYGPGSLTSTIPLLTIGVANLLTGRRARPAIIALLLGCSVWGATTARLHEKGVRDLAPILLGQPSPTADSAPQAPRKLDWFALQTGRAATERSALGSAATAGVLALWLALLLMALRHPPRRLPLSLAGTLLLLLLVGPGTASLRAASEKAHPVPGPDSAAGSATIAAGGSGQRVPAEAAIEDTRRLIRAWEHVENGDYWRARALLADLPGYPAVHELQGDLLLSRGSIARGRVAAHLPH